VSRPPADLAANSTVDERAAELFAQARLANARYTDGLFAALLAAEWLIGVALASWGSPRSWVGVTSSIHHRSARSADHGQHELRHERIRSFSVASRHRNHFAIWRRNCGAILASKRDR